MLCLWSSWPMLISFRTLIFQIFSYYRVLKVSFFHRQRVIRRIRSIFDDLFFFFYYQHSLFWFSAFYRWLHILFYDFAYSFIPYQWCPFCLSLCTFLWTTSPICLHLFYIYLSNRLYSVPYLSISFHRREFHVIHSHFLV